MSYKKCLHVYSTNTQHNRKLTLPNPVSVSVGPLGQTKRKAQNGAKRTQKENLISKANPEAIGGYALTSSQFQCQLLSFVHSARYPIVNTSAKKNNEPCRIMTGVIFT